MDKSEKREKKLAITALTAAILMLSIILFSSIFYIRSSRPLRQAKAEATQLAQEYVDMEEIDSFYWFTRKETYFTVFGKDADSQELIAVIPQSGEQITVLNQNEGISEADVKSIIRSEYSDEEIEKVSFGLFDNQAVWEVMTSGASGNTYYLVTFKEGEIIKVIENI